MSSEWITPAAAPYALANTLGVVGELLQETVDVLDAVGGAEGSLEHRYESQMFWRMRFWEWIDGSLTEISELEPPALRVGSPKREPARR